MPAPPRSLSLGLGSLLCPPLCRTLAAPLQSRQEAQHNSYLHSRPTELRGKHGSCRFQPRDTQLSKTRALSNEPLRCPPPGSQCGSGVERGLPWLLPQVHALAGGTAAGRPGQRPPRTAAEVGPPLGVGKGTPGMGSHTLMPGNSGKSPLHTPSWVFRPALTPTSPVPQPGQRPCRAPSC